MKNREKHPNTVIAGSIKAVFHASFCGVFVAVVYYIFGNRKKHTQTEFSLFWKITLFIPPIRGILSMKTGLGGVRNESGTNRDCGYAMLGFSSRAKKSGTLRLPPAPRYSESMICWGILLNATICFTSAAINAPWMILKISSAARGWLYDPLAAGWHFVSRQLYRGFLHFCQE